MNPRSKKYYENRKAQKGDNKGSATIAGYDEQNEKTIKSPKKNPAPPKEKDQPKLEAKAEQNDKTVKPAKKATGKEIDSAKSEPKAEQDDTGGGNDSGKRTDDN